LIFGYNRAYYGFLEKNPLDDRFDARLRAIHPAALHALLRRLAGIEAFRGWWEGIPKPPGPMLRRMRKDVTAVSAAASTRIAGGGPIAAETGYAEALRAVFERHAAMAPGEGQILALHATVFRGVATARHQAGRYKTSAAPAGIERRWVTEPVALRPPGPLLVPAQMAALTAWLESRIGGPEFHPLLVAAAYLLEFLAIRPFAAGNGRVSRLLTNLLLLREGHACIPYGSLEGAIAARWEEYYLALRRSQASRNLPRPDISPWLLAFLDAVAEQQREVRDALNRLPHEGRLSANQVAVLSIAARDGEVTNRLAASELSLPRETAKQTLNRLVALGALRRLGAGRATRYRPAGG
jgi:Fic family protein